MPLVSLKLMAGVSNLQNDSFTTHQQSVNQSVKQKLHTSHSTSHSLHSHARDVQRVPRSQTRIRVAKPRVNPGSEPVQPPRLAAGWRVDRGGHTNTTHTARSRGWRVDGGTTSPVTQGGAALTQADPRGVSSRDY